MTFSDPKIRIAFAIVIAAIVGFWGWFLLIRDDGDSSSASGVVTPGGGPVEGDVQELQDLQDSLGHTIYWAGDRQGTKLEITQTTTGQVYVRYLPENESAGSSAAYLTVGTYPVPQALSKTKKAAQQAGDDATVSTLPDKTFVYQTGSNPTSTYLAKPDEDLQVEVYDPDGTEGLTLSSSGQVVPVG